MTTLAELAQAAPRARARVLAEYRRERKYDRPYDAAHAVMVSHALGYATGAQFRLDADHPSQVESLALFEAADALRQQVVDRADVQAVRRGVPAWASFWHSGAVKP